MDRTTDGERPLVREDDGWLAQKLAEADVEFADWKARLAAPPPPPPPALPPEGFRFPEEVWNVVRLELGERALQQWFATDPEGACRFAASIYRLRLQAGERLG